MANSIEVQKTLINNEEYNQLVDKEFVYFKKPEKVETLPTVEEFFGYYEQLFLDIPIEGEVNSHEYLVKKSSEVVNIEADTLDVDLLLEEVTTLREQLLLANQQILEYQSTVNTDE